MHFEMEDLIEQANEVQESMSRTYGVPDELDEADLEAGLSFPSLSFLLPAVAPPPSRVRVIELILCYGTRIRCTRR